MTEQFEHLALLPGWSYRAEVLQPLAQALAAHCSVSLHELPASARAADWLDELDARLPKGCWLLGWSLGGMLAAELAARRGSGCSGLVSICSNPCFYARPDWPHALPEAEFHAFCDSFKKDPQSTLKRFDLMVSQGSAGKRETARRLAALHLPAQHPALHAGLRLLARLDCRAALRQFSGRQLHLLANGDAFLPAAFGAHLQRALAQLLPENNRRFGLFSHSGHSLPLTSGQWLAEQILSFVSLRQRNPYRTFYA